MSAAEHEMVAESPEGEVLGTSEVTKRYADGDRRLTAVDEVTLSVPRGALWVLRGPSGSGKSTLLGLMGGMIAPTRGDVRVAGRSISHMRDHHRSRWRRAHVGYLFQELALVPRMSLRENLLLPLVPVGGPDRDALARCEALLARFGLAEHADSRVERLSGGERQRGSLARALMFDPEALLLDEPTAHLDADNAGQVVRLLASLRDDGRAVLAATHDPRLADDPRVDRVLDLVDGRLSSGVDAEPSGTQNRLDTE